MKNLKFKIVSALISASLFVPAISVNAAGVTSGANNLGNGLTKQQKIANKQEWQQYKATITPKKDAIKQNHQTIASLRKEVSEKRATIKTLTKEIKQSNKKLASDDLSKIKTQLQTIKDETSALASTKGAITKDFQTIKTDVKNKNFQDAEAQLDNVISIQNTRIDGLKKLSADMDTLINSLQTVSANVKTS
ncbi:hypothetical protein [Clostridium sp. OS1-26]|uniref:hypothetical protein n=1 Tax=Clostridium sp. OS1-26 TaxID=3070681 RepID=UPI0027E14710|nr:hypothetical protein [Clostridium sp. OS1-26]WML34800.1 hypothetical protein RCG18_26705 [Clostridium sp. OS1-26]